MSIFRRLDIGAAVKAGPFRSITVLASGAAAGHALTAAAMPLVTRLYSPADFAAAASFSAIVGIIVVAACLRFEVAIPLPDDDVEGVNLLGLSIISSASISILTALATVILPRQIWGYVGLVSFWPYLWMIPAAIFVGGAYFALQMWFVRRSDYGSISSSRVVQSAALVTSQLGLGWAGLAPLGLFVGQVFNYGFGAVTLGLKLWSSDRAELSRISIAGMAAAARVHHRFPRYSVVEALANAASVHVPILLIATFAVGPEAGFLALAIFLLQAPMALVGQAVGQVYLSEAPTALREQRLPAFTVDMLMRLTRLSAAPMAFAAVVSPVAFGLVFGQEWTRSGVMVAWMAPWFFFQFLSSPLSTVLHVTGQQGTALCLQLAGLVLRVGAVLASAAFAPQWAVEAYAVSGFVFYGAYLMVAIASAGAPLNSVVRALASQVWWVALALALGGGGSWFAMGMIRF